RERRVEARQIGIARAGDATWRRRHTQITIKGENPMHRSILGKVVIGLALAGIGPGFAAAKLPSTSTIVIGFAAGGSTDATARLIAEELRQATGTNFIV